MRHRRWVEESIGVRHATGRSNHRILRATALTSVAVVCFGLAFGGAAYWKLNSNIHSVNIDAQLGKRPPRATTSAPALPGDPFGGRAVNILLIGSDARTGANASMGGTDVEGMRSDTTIIMHVSADRTRADLVSIPRDTVVNIPECPRSDGTTAGAEYGRQFNAAFSNGGANGNVGDAAACTVRTVEEITNIRLDTFVAVDFTGFKSVINDLGGVEMCIPESVHDKDSGLDLTAGEQRLNGDQALAWARARHAYKDGSDLKRIQRQHELLNSVADQTLTAHLLSNPTTLFKVLNSATSSLTTGSQIGDVNKLAGFAMSLKSVPSANIHFYTAPVVDYPDNTNWVELTPQANELFAKLAADQPVSSAATSAGAGMAAGGNASGGAGQSTAGESGPSGQSAVGGSGSAGTSPTPTSPGPFDQTAVGSSCAH